MNQHIQDGGEAQAAYEALREESDGELLKRLGTDASEWANEFMQRFHVDRSEFSMDRGDLLAWFANALGAGESLGYSKAMDEMHTSAAELGVDMTDVYNTGHAAYVLHGHWQATFAEPNDLEQFLQQLEDAGEECQVPLLDSKQIVWLTYGEERSSGGEACTHWLLQGDPEDQIQETHIETNESMLGRTVREYEPIPLNEANYPVRLLHRPQLP